MDAGSFATDSRTGQRPGHLALRKLANKRREATSYRCSSSCGTKPARTFARERLVVGSGKGSGQHLIWLQQNQSSPVMLDFGFQRGLYVTADTVSRQCEQGRVWEAVESLGVLVETGCVVSTGLVYVVLKKCVADKALHLGRRVHALTTKLGYEADTFLCNHILRMYASHGRLQEAMDVFTMVARPDAFMWSSIISAHVKEGRDKQGIRLYWSMRSTSCVEPDGHVFVAVLQACARAADLKAGQQVHADVLAGGVEPDSFVCNSLVDMYAKCGSLGDAQKVFDDTARKDVVTWNTMIAGYSQQGRGKEALGLYDAMQDQGMAAPDSVTFVSLLQACASLGNSALEKGKQLHAQLRERGDEADLIVANSLVNMYAKCGNLDAAQRVFDGLELKDVVTWSAMMAGYAQQGLGQDALRHYSSMQEEGIVAPNSMTFVSLLQACASMGTTALEKGKQIHAQIREEGLQGNVFVANSLVTMYAKCGSLVEAQGLFDGLLKKDVVTWNAMIAGYSQEGMGQEALCLYRQMREEGIASPNSVTLVCLLQACANVGALPLGRQLHVQVKEQGLQGETLVAISLINMYAKCGSMVEAHQVFEDLSERDVVAWNALIAGYTRRGDCEVVFNLVQRMQEGGTKPNGITFLSVLTACSHAGLVEKGRESFLAMSKQWGSHPTVDHYNCMVDLLGRAGQLVEALTLVRTMPVSPNAAIWHTLLSACCKWVNVEVGCHAFMEAEKLDEQDASAYVLMSNIYTGAKMWQQAKEMQARRKGMRAWKQAGQSWWTDIDGSVYSFLVSIPD